MDFSLGQKRKKEKKALSFFSVNIEVLKAGGNKYTEVDFDEFRREHSSAQQEADALGEELSSYKNGMDVVRRLEAKYNKKGKKKKYRFDHDDFIDRSSGYDFEDGFIDDSEAFEEELPSTMETIKGGFYVNRGTLELRQLEAEIEEEIESDTEEEVEGNKKKKDVESTSEEAASSSKPKQNGVEKEREISRMTGAPPTKRAMSEVEKNAQDAKRKRLTGMPPTLKKVPEKITQREKSPPVTAPSTSVAVPATPVIPAVQKSTPSIVVVPSQPSVVVKAPSQPSVSTITSSSSDIIVIDDAPITKNDKPAAVESDKNGKTNGEKEKTVIATTSSKTEQEIKQQSSSDKSRKDMNFDNVQNILKEFVIVSEEHKKTGKKRLNDDVVDVLIKLEKSIESTDKGFKLQTWTSVTNHLSMSAATLKSRIAARKNDLAKAETLDDDIQVVSQKNGNGSQNQQGTKLLLKADVPHWTEIDIDKLNTMIKSVRAQNNIPDIVVLNSIKEINEKKQDLHSGYQSFIGAVSKYTELNGVSKKVIVVDKISDNNVTKPPRKARVYLDAWAQESNFFYQLKCLARPITPATINEKNLAHMNATLRDRTKTLLSQARATHMIKLTGQTETHPPFVFQYTDLFISGVHSYMEEVYNLAVISKKAEPIITALNSIHSVLKSDVNQGQFFIEICRRLQKIAFIVLDPNVIKMFQEKKISIEKHQVVQNPKYSLKWPNNLTYEQVLKQMKDGNNIAALLQNSAIKVSTPGSTPGPSASSSTTTTPMKTNTSAQAVASTSTSNVTSKSLLEKIADEMLNVFLTKPGTISNIELAKIQQKYGKTKYQEAAPYFQAKLAPKLAEIEKQRKAEVERQRKVEQEKQEAEKKRLERIEIEKKRIERIEAEKKRLAEEKRKKMEQERIEKERLKQKLKEEERLRKEREAREAKERKEKEEEERRKEQERVRREIELIKKQREAEEALRVEQERQKRLEKEKQEAEKIRAAERAKQIEAMRAKAEEQRKKEEAHKDVKPFGKGLVTIKEEPKSQEIEEADAYLQKIINSHMEKGTSSSSTTTSTQNTNQIHQNNMPIQPQPVMPQMNAFSQAGFVSSPSTNSIRSPMSNTSMVAQSPQFHHQSPIQQPMMNQMNQQSIMFNQQQQMNNQSMMNMMQQGSFPPQLQQNMMGMNIPVAVPQPIMPPMNSQMGFQINNMQQQQQQQQQQMRRMSNQFGDQSFLMRQQQQMMTQQRDNFTAQDRLQRQQQQQLQLQQQQLQQQQQQQQQKNMFQNRNYGFH